MNKILLQALPMIIEPRPVAPPNSSPAVDFANYFFWSVVGVGILSIMALGGLMSVGAVEGQAAHKLKGIVWAIVGLVVAASAGGIATYIVSRSGTPVA